MQPDYTGVFRDEDAAEKYENEIYAPGSFSSQVSSRQRQWLRAFIEIAFPVPPVHHDFACGTGRVLRMLDGMVREAHGYDTSGAMLAKAHELETPAELHVIEESGPLPTSESDGPALVTCFRLLLNASPGLRERALEFAAGMLPTAEAGLFVVENHGNASSLRHLRRPRRDNAEEWFAELTHDEVADLLARHGFEVLTMQGFTMLTQGFYRAPVGWIAPALDNVISRRGFLASRATNVLYVARRR